MMDNYGNVLNYNDFCLKHRFVCHPKEFYTVVNAIPKNMVLLIKGFLSHYSVSFSLPSLWAELNVSPPHRPGCILGLLPWFVNNG